MSVMFIAWKILMSRYNEMVGKGVVGLGQNELKKRVKQHKKFAAEAKDKVGLENMIGLMQDFGGNKYIPTNDSTNYKGKEPVSNLSKAIKQTNRDVISAVSNTAKLAYNTYVTVDAAAGGLLPGGVKPYNPFGNKSVKKIAKKNWKKLDR